MDQLTALKELAEKVEAGDETEISTEDIELAFDSDTMEWMFDDCFLHGSLDAAHALHKAVARGWTVANLGQDDSGLWWCELRQEYQTSFLRVSYVGKEETPARAWLLAIIKAKITEIENGTA